MLSLQDIKGSRPIAHIQGGKYHNKIIYLSNDDGNEIYNRPLDMLSEKEIRQNKKKMSKDDYNKIKYGLMYDEEKPIEKDLMNIISNLKGKSRNLSKKQFNLYDDGEIFPLPQFNKTERLYVCGPTESGKSYFIKKYLQKLRKVKPDTTIYIFSDVEEDPEIDELKNITRLNLDEGLLEQETIDIEKFDDSVCVFDDIDSIQHPKIYKMICSLRDGMLRRGRHNNISVVCTSHLMTDYKNTRIILNECNSLCFFPRSGCSSGINYMLKKYCGLNKDQIKKVYDLPSRWVYLNNYYPKYIIYNKGIYIL